MKDVIGLGAGIVGVCVAIHLRRRGFNVVLVDRKPPGRETSYGNAGIIQKEGVRPRSFPRDVGELWRIATKRGLDSRYDVTALPGYASPLAQYWWHSAPERYRKIVADYAPLIANSVSEHADLISAAGADDFVEKAGWMVIFRTPRARDSFFAEAEQTSRDYGVGIAMLDGVQLAAAEPALRTPMAGALHWTEPWTVRDPGGLVAAYAALFTKMGGTIATGDAGSLSKSGAGSSVATSGGSITASDDVLALGPCPDQLIPPHR